MHSLINLNCTWGRADKDTIEKTVDTWRHVFPAYELLVRRNVNAGNHVYYRVHFEPNSASVTDEGKRVWTR